MTPAITAQFQLDYGSFGLDVDLSLPGTGLTAIFGASGCGKTSLLRCIAGLQQPRHGVLHVNSQCWQDSQRQLFLPPHQRPLGYVFQEANLFPHLSVAGNLQFGLKRLGKKWQPQAHQALIDLLGIGALLDRKPAHLSGGERQRVAIARALVLNPDILLMDEPLASLDEQRKQDILPFLTRLHRALKLPVLYVTHSQQEVAQLADHLVILAAGRVQAAGALSQTLSRLDAPLAFDRQAASVWQVCVAEHETDYYLSRVSCDNHSLSLPLLAAPVGAPLRVLIHARDVSIALNSPTASSILNSLPATITGLAQAPQGQVVVQMQVGTQALLAHITQKSAATLRLEIGMAVFAQIKGSSIVN